MKNTITIIAFLLALFSFASCHKDKEFGNEKPKISEVEVSPAQNQADFTWKVEYPGKFQTGVEISSHKDLSDARRVEATKAEDKYKATVDNLTEGTKYYYRIVVWNKYSSFEEEKSDFVTEEKKVYLVEASCQPTDGGRITGTGSYEENKYCTLNAVCNDGYDFVKWTENGTQLSTNANYRFKVTQKRNLVAHFAKQKFTVSLSASPYGTGTVTGGGDYDYGQNCTVSATAASGYTFSIWTENGSQVSTNANYSFTVNDNRTLVAHFTELQADEFNINVSANPLNGGTVTGGGTYQQGQSCSVTATANTGYSFSNWTENGTQVSTDANYTFTVNGNRNLMANFTAQNYTINVLANPSAGGSVSGGGSYTYGQTCTLTATANTGYTFSNWTANGSQVSTTANYSFIVNGNRNLVANFTVLPQAPTGAINGLFTINDNGDQVFFSQGNLQYIGSASTPYWKFADNQWDVLGTNTGQNSANQNVDRDLFGWGTSGWNSGNTYYRPWDTDQSNGSLYGPPGNYNLTGIYVSSDWGYYNAISNGGNTTHQWRTLRGGFHDEWEYIFNARSTSSGIRYAKAQITGTSNGTVNGVILLPDNWSASTYSLKKPNQDDASFSSNVISASEWNTLENAGAVFLPAAGIRRGVSVGSFGVYGYYWSASYGSYNSSSFAESVIFFDSGCNPSHTDGRNNGLSVRLVCPAE